MLPMMPPTMLEGMPRSKKENLFSFLLDDAAYRLRMGIFKLGETENTNSDDMAAAIADVLGIICGKLDAVSGSFTLDDRMEVFTERVKETYNRLRNSGSYAR